MNYKTDSDCEEDFLTIYVSFPTFDNISYTFRALTVMAGIQS